MVSWCKQGHLRLDVRVVGIVLPGASQNEEDVKVPEQLVSVGRGGGPWFISLGALLDAISCNRKYQPLRLVCAGALRHALEPLVLPRVWADPARIYRLTQ